jgi:hypothetical protein
MQQEKHRPDPNAEAPAPALAHRVKPAPISRISGLRSKTVTWMPSRCKAEAADSPPMPPPMMLTWSVCFFIGSLSPLLHLCAWCSQMHQRRNYLNLISGAKDSSLFHCKMSVGSSSRCTKSGWWREILNMSLEHTLPARQFLEKCCYCFAASL